MEQQAFINSIKDGAIAGQKQYGVLASVTIAQAIIESGWGQYTIGTANNLFGIKNVSGWTGRTVNSPTKEFKNGGYVSVMATFRAYDNLGESLKDHAMFLTQNSRYKNLLGVKDYKQACTLIQQDGYATAPNYASSLIQIIEQYKIYQYDNIQQAPQSIVVPAPAPTPTIQVNSKVKMIGNKYATGQSIPLWAKLRVYDVLRINNNEVLVGIGKAVTGWVWKSECKIA